MKNSLYTFLEINTHRKTIQFPAKLKNLINSLPQIVEILNPLDLILKKINKRNPEKHFFSIKMYLKGKLNNP
tara:strand:- start:2906 stop:3121 length:216 start_codon:yes stop_codon:yes gene_type:complete